MSLVWVFVVPGYFIPGSYDQAKLSIVKRLAWYLARFLVGFDLALNWALPPLPSSQDLTRLMQETS